MRPLFPMNRMTTLSKESFHFIQFLTSCKNLGKKKFYFSNYFIEFVHYVWVNQLALGKTVSDNKTQMIIFHWIIFSNFLPLHTWLCYFKIFCFCQLKWKLNIAVMIFTKLGGSWFVSTWSQLQLSISKLAKSFSRQTRKSWHFQKACLNWGQEICWDMVILVILNILSWSSSKIWWILGEF